MANNRFKIRKFEAYRHNPSSRGYLPNDIDPDDEYPIDFYTAWQQLLKNDGIAIFHDDSWYECVQIVLLGYGSSFRIRTAHEHNGEVLWDEWHTDMERIIDDLAYIENCRCRIMSKEEIDRITRDFAEKALKIHD